MKTTGNTGVVVLMLLFTISCTKESSKSNLILTTQTENISVLKKFHLGDTAGGGIIFYLDSTRQHGFIAATSDLGEFTWWNELQPGCGDIATGMHYINTRTTARAIGKGATNTDTIILKQGNTGSYAAKACRDYRGGGFNDWFLPSADELMALQKAYSKGITGGFAANENYSSSTEYHSKDFGTCEHYFSYVWWFNGVAFYGPKYYSLHVRPIRAF